MKEMTSRERVMRVLNHQEPDRVPIDFGGTVVTCMELHAHKKLKRYLGIEDDHDPIIDYTMGTVEPCAELVRRFGSDVRRVGLNVIPPHIENDMYEGGFGIRYKNAKPHEYYDVCYSPLADAEIEDLATMSVPDAEDPALYAGLRERAKELYEGTDSAIFADFGVPGFYETSQKARGYQNLACDLVDDSGFIFALYDRMLEIQKAYFKRYLEAVGGYAAVVGYADDLGMQDRPQMSPATYRAVLKPYHKKIFTFIHEQADIKIMLHSCGAVEPLIEDLMDAGVDIFNPLQTSAAGMQPEPLMKKYAGRTVFWGGLDIQKLLPFGTPDEVEEGVRRMMREMDHRSYVFAPAHNIQSDTPPENILRMFEAANRYR